jgi:hypothetical protein
MCYQASQAYDRHVWIPWLTRSYERTCEKCGYVWRVPKEFARPHMQGLQLYGGADAGGQAGAAVAANAQLAEQAAAFRRCARCESSEYRQRAIWARSGRNPSSPD